MDTLKISLSKKWEIKSGFHLDSILKDARKLGWLENKVQVRKYEDIDGNMQYIIEPYEENCGCPGIIKPPSAPLMDEE